MTNEEFIKSISIEEEEWRDVVGFEGFYKVSNLGRIVALERQVIGRWDKPRTQYAKLLKLKPNKYGYIRITLHDDHLKAGKQNSVTKGVHKIVLEAFSPNPNNYPSKDHINCDKTDNRLENLKWCSCKENSNNPITKQHMSDSAKQRCAEGRHRKEPIVRVSLDNSEVVYYEMIDDAVKEGFTGPSIVKVCKGRLNKHKDYKWYYLSDNQQQSN